MEPRRATRPRTSTWRSEPLGGLAISLWSLGVISAVPCFAGFLGWASLAIVGGGGWNPLVAVLLAALCLSFPLACNAGYRSLVELDDGIRPRPARLVFAFVGTSLPLLVLASVLLSSGGAPSLSQMVEAVLRRIEQLLEALRD